MPCDMANGPGVIGRVRASVSSWWTAVQQRYFWLRHVLAAYRLMQRNHANEYAAAITYFSFLALFPLLLLAVSVTGFVLHSHPDLQTKLFDNLASNVGSGLGTTLRTAIQNAIDARAGVGIVGLVGFLLTGLGWIGNLREAIDAVWGRPVRKRNFLTARLANLVVLAGLGVGVVVSIGLTTVGTSLTDQVLSAVGLDHVHGFFLVVKVLGIAIAVAGDMIIFWWLLIRLPDARIERSVALRGVLLAAVGFEVLKVVGSYTVAHTSKSTTYGPFAVTIAVLVWIQLVARYQLFACAWIATADTGRTANSVPIAEPPAMRAESAAAASDVSPAVVGAALVGAGALVGAASVLAVGRGRRGGGDERR